jgi:hypothetical protein
MFNQSKSVLLAVASLMVAGSALAQTASRSEAIRFSDAIPEMTPRPVQKAVGQTVGADWEAPLPPEMAMSKGIAAFRRNLSAVVKDASGVALLSVELGDKGTSGTMTRKALDEVPTGQEPVGLAYMPKAGQLWLATTASAKDAGGMLFSSGFDAKGLPTGFRRQELPSAIKEVISIKVSDNVLAVVARENLGERGGIRVWGAPWLESKLGTWQSSDQLLTARADFATLLDRSSMTVLGGTPEGRSPKEMTEARECWSVRFGNDMISQWRADAQPLPWPVEGPSATTAEPISIVAGRMPKGAVLDSETSLTLLIAGEIGKGTRGSWRPVVTNAAARLGAKLVINEADSQLLVIGGKDSAGRDVASVASISIPRWADSLSMEALEARAREEAYQRSRYSLGKMTFDEAVAAAVKQDKYILTIIPGPGEEGRDFITTLGDPRSAGRKMMTGALINVADDGKVPSGLPGKLQPNGGSIAVLHTASGNVLRTMDTPTPSPEDFFQLTAPIRDPAGTHPAPGQ